MIEEAYVKYDVANLLKEKGFDETCYACYEYFKSSITMYSGWPFEYKGEVVHNSKDVVKCPTQQMAMRWLREVHNIDIDCKAEVGMLQVKRYVPIIKTYHPKYDKELGKDRLNQKLHSTSKIFPVYDDFATYEEAIDEAIEYCLENLI